MSFVIQPSQAPDIAAQTGAAVGAAQAAQDRAKFEQALALSRIEQSDRYAAELRRLDAEKSMAVFREQIDQQAQQRAMAWEVEKMERRSRIDFEAQEEQHAKQQQEYEAGLAAIENSPAFGDDPQSRIEKDKLRLALELRHAGLTDTGLTRQPREERSESIQTAISRIRALAGGRQDAPLSSIIQNGLRAGRLTLADLGPTLLPRPEIQALPAVQAALATEQSGAPTTPEQATIPQGPKPLTVEIATAYLIKYGNREAAMAAAHRDGYVEQAGR